MCRRIALEGPDCLVEGGVSHPGLENAVIEVETVHLGTHQVPVHLLLNGLAAWFYRIKAILIGFQFCVGSLKSFHRVVRRTAE